VALVDDVAEDAWKRLSPGARVTVVKRSPEGFDAARYPGDVVITRHPWVLVRAEWTYQAMDIDGLTFQPGDHLYEWFSPRHPFNAFAVVAPDEQARGWYANVTFPAQLDSRQEPPQLIWHDLYLDLVALPDGTFTLRDDDELHEAGIAARDPRLYEMIVEASAELVRRFTAGRLPFVLPRLSGGSNHRETTRKSTAN
jgi:hypothetical protein